MAVEARPDGARILHAETEIGDPVLMRSHG
jgi:hypothetical protein